MGTQGRLGPGWRWWGLCLFLLFSAFCFQKLLERESLLMPNKHLLCGRQCSSHIPRVIVRRLAAR